MLSFFLSAATVVAVMLVMVLAMMILLNVKLQECHVILNTNLKSYLRTLLLA